VNAQDTSAEPPSDLQLEIAHVLLIDAVGYSRLLGNEQVELLRELNQLVRGTQSFRAAEANDKLIRVPTGDGMALLFFQSPEEPVRCALQISKLLRDRPHIQLRMGVHSGPVNRVTDVNDKTNIAGSGMNVAQRVLDCVCTFLIFTKTILVTQNSRRSLGRDAGNAELPQVCVQLDRRHGLALR
jgi:class 3 adenylate cyclase